MCGIAGLAGWADRGTIERMTACLAHRGPDDAGIHVEPEAGIALGHRRLAILDLSPAGHQPMTVGDGSLILCYNGEIYNYRELRAGLAADGVQFRSQTDSEVILQLYARDGADCVRQLNGIFAFAIWDRRERRLLLARDHFGTKPLYYADRGGRLAFASEAKALFEVPGLSPEVDLDSLNLFLTFLWTPDPQTAFAGVHKLPAGHLAEWRDGRLTIRRYWDLLYPAAASRPAATNPTAQAAEFRARFGAAVERQMVSDVPLGAFLSAGLDSSAIVYEMQQRSREPVRTYTISFAGTHARGDVTLDDASVAADTAKAFGCRHTPIVVEPDVAALLPKLVWHMDEPTADPAIILAYLVNREARREVTVLLSGIGGDEVLGGYRKYVAAMDARRYQQLPAALRRHVLDPAFRHAPATPGTPWAGYGRLLRKWGRSASLPPRAQFIENGTYLSAADRRALLRPDVREQIAVDSATRFHEAAFDRVDGADWLQPDDVRRHQDLHGVAEPDLQRQDEHGVGRRGAGAVPRLGAGRMAGDRGAAGGQAGRAHHQGAAARGLPGSAAGRGARRAESRLRRADRPLADGRPARDGRRPAQPGSRPPPRPVRAGGRRIVDPRAACRPHRAGLERLAAADVGAVDDGVLRSPRRGRAAGRGRGPGYMTGYLTALMYQNDPATRPSHNATPRGRRGPMIGILCRGT